jgi:hypothetical protein
MDPLLTSTLKGDRHGRTEMCNAEVAGKTQVRCTFVIRKASRNPQCLCDRFFMILRKLALLHGDWVQLIIVKTLKKGRTE